MTRDHTDRRGARAGMMRGLLVGAGLAWAAAAGIGPAAAQQSNVPRPLLDRLDRMERDLNLLQRQIYRGQAETGAAPPPAQEGGTGGAASSGALARMEVRLSELESTLRTLTGKIEEVSFSLKKLEDRVERETGDMELRLSDLERSMAGAGVQMAGPGASPEGAGGAFAAESAREGAGIVNPRPGRDLAASGDAGPAETAGPGGTMAGEGGQPGEGAGATAGGEGVPTQTAAVLPQGTPKEQYDHALSLLRQADYAAAEKGLRAFIDAHPDDELSENAQYWLGETYYVRSDYANAAVVFAEGLQKFSEGQKAPANLLKLGMSLGNLGETDQACKAFAELERKYPDASLSVRERASREKQRLDCP